MATNQAIFQDVLAKFTARLTKEEIKQFKFSSVDDVKDEVLKIQDAQGRRGEMMNLPRIQSFLEAMQDYGKVIEVFLNASSVLCFIWGPMKFCLQVRVGIIILTVSNLHRRLQVHGLNHLILFSMLTNKSRNTYLS